MARHPMAFAILVGGSIAGALDITFAITFAKLNGVPAARLLQSVASGLLGKEAYAGGIFTATLGLVLHMLLAYLIAAIYCVTSRRVPVLNRRAWISGLLYGVVVFLVMRLVVLPLSAFPHPVTFRPVATIADLLSHMLLFGLPIALLARRASQVGHVTASKVFKPAGD